MYGHSVSLRSDFKLQLFLSYLLSWSSYFSSGRKSSKLCTLVASTRRAMIVSGETEYLYVAKDLISVMFLSHLYCNLITNKLEYLISTRGINYSKTQEEGRLYLFKNEL